VVRRAGPPVGSYLRYLCVSGHIDAHYLQVLCVAYHASGLALEWRRCSTDAVLPLYQVSHLLTVTGVSVLLSWSVGQILFHYLFCLVFSVLISDSIIMGKVRTRSQLVGKKKPPKSKKSVSKPKSSKLCAVSKSGKRNPKLPAKSGSDTAAKPA
jgi:hypothetical protein